MKLALVADPHLSFLKATHEGGLDLSHTPAIIKAVIDDLERRRPDLTVWTGDLTHEGTPNIRNAFRDLYQTLTVPSLAFVGNHDVELGTKHQFAQVIPTVRRTWLAAFGWDVLIVDTVRELSQDTSGDLSEVDIQLINSAASTSKGSLLIMGHHPLSSKWMSGEPFWEAVRPFKGTGVYIGSHTHEDRYEFVNNWHVIEIGSASVFPYGYRWLELSHDCLTLKRIQVNTNIVQNQVKAASPSTTHLPFQISTVVTKAAQ